ncbi:MAG TPA: ABC transporter permease [Pseudonocardiaceae bacterium]|nr:ABC transporter permease [Pseudonocardiaceae bacterium]
MTTSASDTTRASDTRPPRPRAARRRRGVTRRRVLVTVLQVAILAAVLGTWQLFADNRIGNPLFTSAPDKIAKSLWNGLTQGSTLANLGTTLYETLVGFAISVVIGTVFGVLFYAVPFLGETFRPYVAALNSLPRLALTPLFILWFGIGSSGRVALIITIVSFIVLVNTLAGLQNASRDHLLLARTIGASTWQTFTKFMLPSAAPALFAGLQLGLTVSFLGAVIAELISGGSGLGAEISSDQSNFDTAGMFADLFLIGVVAAILAGIMRLAERYLMAWREVDMRGVTGDARRR